MQTQHAGALAPSHALQTTENALGATFAPGPLSTQPASEGRSGRAGSAQGERPEGAATGCSASVPRGEGVNSLEEQYRDNSTDEEETPLDRESYQRWKKEQKRARRLARSAERKAKAAELRAKGIKPNACPHSRSVMVGECTHGAKRFIAAPCGARDCAYCGPIGRSEIGKRISDGVRRFWALGAQCAWLVLTFPRDVEKEDAVDAMGRYVAWLRRRIPWMEYAATYEVTRRGRLHINLVVGPWVRIPQRELQDGWQKVLKEKLAIVHVRMVNGGSGGAASVGVETAKALSGYLAKLEQSVSEDRRVSFSRGWPRVEHTPPEREGTVKWRPATVEESERFEVERKLGEWVQRQGEWLRASHLPCSEECTCFRFKAPVCRTIHGPPTVEVAAPGGVQ